MYALLKKARKTRRKDKKEKHKQKAKVSSSKLPSIKSLPEFLRKTAKTTFHDIANSSDEALGPQAVELPRTNARLQIDEGAKGFLDFIGDSRQGLQASSGISITPSESSSDLEEAATTSDFVKDITSSGAKGFLEFINPKPQPIKQLLEIGPNPM